LLEELVSLAPEDHAISEGINCFLDDLLVETGRLVESSKKALAKREAAGEKPKLEIKLLSAHPNEVKHPVTIRRAPVAAKD
jgi:hypothetical protein